MTWLWTTREGGLTIAIVAVALGTVWCGTVAWFGERIVEAEIQCCGEAR